MINSKIFVFLLGEFVCLLYCLLSISSFMIWPNFSSLCTWSFQDDSKLYIFLELVTKGSLLSLYQKYDLRESQASAYTRQILNGLKYLHEQNVVHRWYKLSYWFIIWSYLSVHLSIYLFLFSCFLTISFWCIALNMFWLFPFSCLSHQDVELICMNYTIPGCTGCLLRENRFTLLWKFFWFIYFFPSLLQCLQIEILNLIGECSCCHLLIRVIDDFIFRFTVSWCQK